MNNIFHNQNTLPVGATLRKDNVDKPLTGEAFFMEQEIWKDIVGYEGSYMVSSFGRIKSLERNVIGANGKRVFVRERIMRQTYHVKGYKMVALTVGNRQKRCTVHRLVALSFIPNPENKPQVNHIDGKKMNNNFSNLEWVTPIENLAHAVCTGLLKIKGEKHPNTKLSDDDALKIRSGYASNKKMAKDFGVSLSTISNIINRKTWTYI